MKLHFPRITLFSLVGLSYLLTADPCSATPYAWNGSASSDWFNALNWTPNGIPGSTDTVNFTNGIINLTSPVTNNAVFNWAGGTLSGKPLTIGSGGVLNITAAATLYNVLTNAGTVTMSGLASLSIYDNNTPTYLGGVDNLAGALWDIQTNASIACGICAGYEYFNNAGTFRRSQGSSTASVGINFTNSGTVTNLVSQLSFNAGGNLMGTYYTAAGATTEFAGGNFTMGVPPVISGPGLCEFGGATLTLLENVPANLLLASGNLILGPAFQNNGAITNLTLSGSTLVSTNTLTGVMNWVGGIISGRLTVGSGGMLNITGPVTLYNVLTNAGTVTMSGLGSLSVYNNNTPTYFGGVDNLAGALWDIQTNATIACGICAGYEYFNNAGTFRRSQGTSTASVGINFTNSGTVNALVNALDFTRNFSTSGGTLAFGVSSLSSFGLINISGNVALNGTASVSWLNGFAPAVGNSFALLDYGSQSGTFVAITLPPGYLGQGTYGPTVFSVMVTSTTAQTNSPVFLNIQPGPPNNVVVSWPSSATNYSLQTSTNLPSGSWSDVLSGITTVGAKFVLTNSENSKAGFFRLRSP